MILGRNSKRCEPRWLKAKIVIIMGDGVGWGPWMAKERRITHHDRFMENFT